MIKQELVQETKKIMHKTYCNGITINHDQTMEAGNTIKFFLDYLIPKRVLEEKEEYTFYIKLRNVGVITLSKEGKLISKSTSDEFIRESIQKYKELIEKREKFIIKLFADKLIRVQQIYLCLTPMRKVLRSFLEQDFLIDNLKRNFDYKEIKYINFLKSFGYLRKEGNKYTLDNHYIKKLDSKIDERNKEDKIRAITASIFAEHFDYMISELSNTSIVPFIGIITTFCNLLLEMNKNISLSIRGLYELYKEHYLSGQGERSFEDKIINMGEIGLIEYDHKDKNISLPSDLFDTLIKTFKLSFTQKQLG